MSKSRTNPTKKASLEEEYLKDAIHDSGKLKSGILKEYLQELEEEQRNQRIQAQLRFQPPKNNSSTTEKVPLIGIEEPDNKCCILF